MSFACGQRYLRPAIYLNFASEELRGDSEAWKRLQNDSSEIDTFSSFVTSVMITYFVSFIEKRQNGRKYSGWSSARLYQYNSIAGPFYYLFIPVWSTVISAIYPTFTVTRDETLLGANTRKDELIFGELHRK